MKWLKRTCKKRLKGSMVNSLSGSSLHDIGYEIGSVVRTAIHSSRFRNQYKEIGRGISEGFDLGF